MSRTRTVAMPVAEPAIFTDEDSRVIVEVATQEAIFRRIREAAVAQQGTEPKPAAIALSFETPDGLLGALTPLRYALFKSVREHGSFISIDELARCLRRDPVMVSRDVQELEALGLLEVETVSPAGNGRSRRVNVVAGEVRVQFSL